MSKHSKGPWRYWACTIDSASGMRDYIQLSAEDREVARLPIEHVNQHDMALIAAAPDLLEALVGMMQVYGGGTQWNPPTSTELELHDLARVAIARARGEA